MNTPPPPSIKKLDPLKIHYRFCHVIKRPKFDGYGFNLHSDKGKSGQYIGKIDGNSPAEAAGLKEGDRIIEVNGVNIGSETHKQVVERIKAISNEVHLLVIDPILEIEVLKRQKTVLNATAVTTHTSNNMNQIEPEILTSSTITIKSTSTITAPTKGNNKFSMSTFSKPSPPLIETIPTLTTTIPIDSNDKTIISSNYGDLSIDENNSLNNNYKLQVRHQIDEVDKSQTLLNCNQLNDRENYDCNGKQFNKVEDSEKLREVNSNELLLIDNNEHISNNIYKISDSEYDIKKITKTFQKTIIVDEQNTRQPLHQELQQSNNLMNEQNLEIRQNNIFMKINNNNNHNNNNNINNKYLSKNIQQIKLNQSNDNTKTKEPENLKKNSQNDMKLQENDDSVKPENFYIDLTKQNQFPLNLPMTVAEMRAKLSAEKKKNVKNEAVDLRKKFEIIQKL